MRLDKHWMLHYETTKQSESCPSVGSFLIHPDVDHTNVGHPNHLKIPMDIFGTLQ